MDKFEFIEKSKYECSDEEYQKIEKVYLDCPTSVVGSYVTEFCAWFNKNGKMKAIEMMYPLAVEIGKQNETIKLLKSDLAHYEMELDHLTDVSKEMAGKISFYEKCVTDSMLDAYLTDMSREEKIAILSKRF